MADMYNYNGVILPEIPADVLAEYPYAWIIGGNSTMLLLSKNGSYVSAVTDSNFTINAPSGGRIAFTLEENTWGEGIVKTTSGSWNFPVSYPFWSNHDIPNGSADAELIYYPAMPAYRVVDVFAPDEFAIKKTTLTAMADAVREKKGSTAVFTPEQMADEVRGIVTSDNLPNAEESVFGAVATTVENGVRTWGTATAYWSSYTYRTFGWVFLVKEDFDIVGLRHGHYRTGNYILSLWDMDGNLLRQETTSDIRQNGVWVECHFDTPVAAKAGEKYFVSIYSQYRDQSLLDTTVFDPRIEFVEMRTATGNAFPEEAFVASPIVVEWVDILTAPSQPELPSEFKVGLRTMDDIAEEVQRISETETKMTTAQIITALQGVENLEDLSEVAF